MLNDPRNADLAADLLKAIAHPTRLRIVAALVHGDLHVGGLAEHLGLKQPIISQQLKILRLKGLVDVTRANGLATYRIIEPHLETIVGCMQRCLLSRQENHR
ncbi:MAG: metalloregulator ArsR/SmtB family transcription factor [Pseudomonadota bacterium]